MEALTAIRAKVFFIIGVFHAHTFAAIGRLRATIKAKPADFALVYLAERRAALLAYMFNPIAAFNTIIAAVATFVYRVIVTAVGAKFAKTANFKTVVKKTAFTLGTQHATVYAVIPAVSARFTEGIAVAALDTVHIFLFYAILAPTAIGANVRTRRTFPTVSAKGIPIVKIAIAAFGTVYPVVCKAILTKMALVASEITVQKARAAPHTMVIVMARSVRAIFTASAAPLANIIIVMPMPAAGALDTVFPTGKSRHGKNRAQQYPAQQNT